MRYAICNETFGDWPLEKAVEYAAQAGYTGWEVAPFMLAADIRQWTSQQRIAYRQVVSSGGLEIIGLHWLLAKTTGFHLTSPDAAVRAATADYLVDLARLCGDLGGTLMVLGSPLQRNILEGVEEQQANRYAADVLASIDKQLAANNVKIALEPLGPQETNFMNTADDARRLRDMIGSSWIGLHLDMKAMSSEPTSIPEIIKSHHDWMLHFHANDPNRLGPGMGDLQVQPVMAALNEVGYDGWVSVEVFDYSPGVEALVTESIENLKAANISRR